MSKLDYVPSWSVCKTIYGNRGVNALSLLPVFGYLIFVSESLVDYLASLNWLIEIDVEFISVSLKRIFLGLLSILLGLIFYLIFCPTEIRLYQDRIEYAEQEKKNFTPRRLEQLKSILVKSEWMWFMLSPDYKSRIRSISNVMFLEFGISEDAQTLADRDGFLSRDGYIQKFGLDINEIYDLWYEVKSRTRTVARAVSLFLGAVGYVLLIYPSIKIVYLVALSL